MLGSLGLVLTWFVNDVRPRFADGPALFYDEGGGLMHPGSVRNRLAHLLVDAAGANRSAVARLGAAHGGETACAAGEA